MSADKLKHGARWELEQCVRVRDVNAELLEALELCLNEMGRGMGIDDRFDSICYKARLAIARAKGEV